MITKVLWEDLFYGYFWGNKYTSGVRTLGCLLLSIFTIPLDIILLPLEIIAFIINRFF